MYAASNCCKRIGTPRCKYQSVIFLHPCSWEEKVRPGRQVWNPSGKCDLPAMQSLVASHVKETTWTTDFGCRTWSAQQLHRSDATPRLDLFISVRINYQVISGACRLLSVFRHSHSHSFFSVQPDWKLPLKVLRLFTVRLLSFQVKMDPSVFFSLLFGSERFEPWIGELHLVRGWKAILCRARRLPNLFWHIDAHMSAGMNVYILHNTVDVHTFMFVCL